MPISVTQLREARTVTLSNGDRYRFSWLEWDAAVHLTDEQTTALDDRQYIAEALSTLLEEPDVSADELNHWSDTSLLELATGYLTIGTGASLVDTEDVPTPPTDLAQSRHAIEQKLTSGRDRLEAMAGRAAKSFTNSLTRLWLSDSLAMGQSISRTLNQITENQTAILRGLISTPTQFANLGQTTQSIVDALASRQTDYLSALQIAVAESADVGAKVAQLMQSFNNYDFSRSISIFNSCALAGLTERRDQLHRARRADLLIDAQLEFLNDFTEDVIAVLVDDAPVRGRQKQRAYITRQLYRLTSSPEFWHELETELQASPDSRRRIPILRSAHQAHQRRDFVLSIPALLAQMEGLLASVLCEMGLLRWNRRKQKWYQADPQTGDYVMVPERKKGELTGQMVRVEASGLHSLTNRGKSPSSSSLAHTVPHIQHNEAKMRNRVLHGTYTNYGTSRNSSKLLLIILKLARERRLLQEANARQDAGAEEVFLD